MPSSIRDFHMAILDNQRQETIFSRMTQAGKSWTVYYSDISSSWVLQKQRSANSLSNYKSIDNFFQEASYGDLPSFAFIEPQYYGRGQNDGHPPHNVMYSDKLLGDVYNVLRCSPSWEKVLLIVTYDEHGGFYDHVDPPTAVPPDGHQDKYSFNRYGPRVPSVLVSPMLDKGVDHTVFDHTSVLKYLSDLFGLDELSDRVNSANSIEQALRFRSDPRSDTLVAIHSRSVDLASKVMAWEEFARTSSHGAIEAMSILPGRAM